MEQLIKKIILRIKRIANYNKKNSYKTISKNGIKMMAEVLNNDSVIIHNPEYNLPEVAEKYGLIYKKKVPMLYIRKEDCCGCTACFAICPKNAIVMSPDEEGFEYPCIDARECIRCGRCIMVCPINRE